MQTSLGELLRLKGGAVVTIGPDATVFEAVSLMESSRIGSLLVVDARDAIAGILTERDCLRKVLLRERNLRTVAVGEVMSTPVFTLPPETELEECMRAMTERRIRHLPVVEGGRLLGLISIGDVVKHLCGERGRDIANLEKYITGSI